MAMPCPENNSLQISLPVGADENYPDQGIGVLSNANPDSRTNSA